MSEHEPFASGASPQPNETLVTIEDETLPLIAIVDDNDVVAEAEKVLGHTRTKGAEAALFGMLTETESIEKLFEAGFRVTLIPTSDLRDVYRWAIQQHDKSGVAPTTMMFETTEAPGFGGKSWSQVLQEHGIDITHVPVESVEWVIEELRSRKLAKDVGEQLRRLAEDITAAPAANKEIVFQDWLTAMNEYAYDFGGGGRGRVVGIPATADPKAIRWLWDERLELKAFSLLAGRPSIGKSTIAVHLMAQVTKGTLEGYCFGKPRSVIIAATEDDFESVIIPRLIAAGADRSKVFLVKVKAHDKLKEITIPVDLDGLQQLIIEKDAALVLLDPLMSRLGDLDTHKDAEVRKALEPLVDIAVQTKATVLGIIHTNKGNSKDSMHSIMGSTAFVGVARTTLMAMNHPEDPQLRILCTDKNNHAEGGKDNRTYRIEGQCVGKDTDDGDDLDIWTSRIEWVGIDTRSANDILEALSHAPQKESKVELAKLWLKLFLSDGGKLKAEVSEAAKDADISEHTLRRAREELEEDGSLETERLPGKPPKVEWRLSSQPTCRD